MQLSGGERRRVEIARCLCIQPSFILLDEPFSGIDPIAVTDLQEIIFDLKASGIGVLITDHNVRETLSVTDRAYIINEGRIFRTGTPDHLGRDPEVRRVYLGGGFLFRLLAFLPGLPRCVGMAPCLGQEGTLKKSGIHAAIVYGPWLQPRLSLKVAQRQILTPGLMQMVSVLALNKLELKEMINTEIVENPVLEELEENVPLLDDVASQEAERERPAEEIVADASATRPIPSRKSISAPIFRNISTPASVRRTTTSSTKSLPLRTSSPSPAP
jgi:hypothetical protein